MVATIVNYTRGGVNTPGLDAGTFTAPASASGTPGVSQNDVLIITKMRYPIALLVTELISTGAAFFVPTQSAGVSTAGGNAAQLGRAPAVGVFSTVQSSGAFVPAQEIAPGQSYQWICAGL